MSGAGLTVALIHDVFADAEGPARLAARLEEARRRGAELALLPELPLDPWIPARRGAREADAEPPGGPRERRLAAAARAAGIAVAGGAIVRDAAGRRFNRALLHDGAGRLVATYDKLHVPSEEGYWERDHYEPGDAPARRIGGFDLPLGFQICSDLNRPSGSLVLGALGVGLILAPRATPPETYERWRLVIRANAITAGSFAVSVNRPSAEGGAAIGGPSLAVAPDGEVLLESTAPLSVVRLDAERIERARRDYPGYLDVRAALYARAWAEVAVRGATDGPGAGDPPT